MIIKCIRIKEGMFERSIDFSDQVNLIHSELNSKGKTTLLRFMLYAMGYNIPSTRQIRFDRCEVETNIMTEGHGLVTLFRTGNDFIVATTECGKETFVLPDQMNELHAVLFGTDNADILNNLLGAFYVDQEKGWTLLNRGVVIGSIHFNIEELIRGLSGRDCSDLINEEIKLSRNLGKYRQMQSVAKYQESISHESGTLVADTYDETIDLELNQLLIEQAAQKKELNRIDRTINDNKHFKRFVAEIKLLIQLPDGHTIPVTEDNIVGLNDTMDFLIAKRKILAADLSRLSICIDRLKDKRTTENQQMAFYNSETLAEAFDRNITSVPINAVAIAKEITQLEFSLSKVRKEISDKTKANNSVAMSMYNNILKYAVELGIGDDKSIAASYLFTSNLKELSGAVLHKTVFAFRLAYIIAIEEALKIKLPIILDSPSGKEIDPKNIQLMVDILKRDFSSNQLIIASIFRYDFDAVNTIEIVNRLVETS